MQFGSLSDMHLVEITLHFLLFQTDANHAMLELNLHGGTIVHRAVFSKSETTCGQVSPSEFVWLLVTDSG